MGHPVLAEIGRRDKRVNFADGDAVLFQFGARREADSKKRTLRRRVNAVLRTVMNAVPELTFTMLPLPCARISGITDCIATIGPSTLRWKISSKTARLISSTAAA